MNIIRTHAPNREGKGHQPAGMQSKINIILRELPPTIILTH